MNSRFAYSILVLTLILSANLRAEEGNSNSNAFHWGLNDVSFLFPIQDHNVTTELPSVATSGAFGPLLPFSVIQQIGRLQSFEDPKKSYSDLRMVAARIDPCFPAPENPSICRAQVRLVWQPVQIVRGRAVGADAAIHTFYNLPATDFRALTDELKMLRMSSDSAAAKSSESAVSNRDLPLSVHPIIRREGLSGPYFQGFKRAILKRIGRDRLSRATFVKLSSGFFLWDFGGFDVIGGRLVPMVIPRTGRKRQMFTNNVMPGETEFVESGIAPSPLKSEANVNFITSESSRIRQKDAEPLIIQNVIDAAAMENPRKFKTAELDCVSCHIAQAARLFAVGEFREMNLGAEAAKITYRSKTQSLKVSSRVGHITGNLRSFGYFYGDPAISARVIHESAEVADALNSGSAFNRPRISRER